MLHPDPGLIHDAMDRLERCIDNRPEARLNMQAGSVYAHDCGTTACVGGWYALAAIEDHDGGACAFKYYGSAHPVLFDVLYGVSVLSVETKAGERRTIDKRMQEGWRAVDYWDDGADRLGRDLGFADGHRLCDWASSNPHYWGNDSGAAMFSDDAAYWHAASDEEAPEVTLETVIAHWRGVADRIDADELTEHL